MSGTAEVCFYTKDNTTCLNPVYHEGSCLEHALDLLEFQYDQGDSEMEQALIEFVLKKFKLDRRGLFRMYIESLDPELSNQCTFCEVSLDDTPCEVIEIIPEDGDVDWSTTIIDLNDTDAKTSMEIQSQLSKLCHFKGQPDTLISQITKHGYHPEMFFSNIACCFKADYKLSGSVESTSFWEKIVFNNKEFIKAFIHAGVRINPDSKPFYEKEHFVSDLLELEKEDREIISKFINTCCVHLDRDKIVQCLFEYSLNRNDFTDVVIQLLNLHSDPFELLSNNHETDILIPFSESFFKCIGKDHINYLTVPVEVTKLICSITNRALPTMNDKFVQKLKDELVDWTF